MMAEQEPVNLHAYNFKVMDILGTLGLVVGPIVGGYIFEYDKGFLYICLLSGSFSLLSTCVYIDFFSV